MSRAQKNESRIAYEIPASFSVEHISLQMIENTHFGTIAPIAGSISGRRIFCEELLEKKEIQAVLRQKSFHLIVF